MSDARKLFQPKPIHRLPLLPPISPAAQCELDRFKRNLRLADQAIAEVSRYLTLGAANKLGDVVTSLGGSVVCVLAMRSVTQERLETASDWIEVLAAGARATGCGNCGEQAAIAFDWLRDQGVRPLDYMTLNPGDHAFVVIGRAPGSDANDSGTWGREAVICDPWKDAFYGVVSIAAHLDRRTGFTSEERLD